MAFLDLFRSRQATMAPTSSYAWKMSVPGIRSAAGMGPEQLYRESPPLRTVVDYIARNVAQLPLKVYVRKDDNDRRVVRATITDKGRQMLEAKRELIHKEYKGMFDILGEKDVRELIRLLRIVLAYYPEYNETDETKTETD
jgi:hypothetical protein